MNIWIIIITRCRFVDSLKVCKMKALFIRVHTTNVVKAECQQMVELNLFTA